MASRWLGSAPVSATLSLDGKLTFFRSLVSLTLVFLESVKHFAACPVASLSMFSLFAPGLFVSRLRVQSYDDFSRFPNFCSFKIGILFLS